MRAGALRQTINFVWPNILVPQTCVSASNKKGPRLALGSRGKKSKDNPRIHSRKISLWPSWYLRMIDNHHVVITDNQKASVQIKTPFTIGFYQDCLWIPEAIPLFYSPLVFWVLEFPSISLHCCMISITVLTYQPLPPVITKKNVYWMVIGHMYNEQRFTLEQIK